MSGPFGAESTADEVLEGVDLHGKRVLVTGVSAGIGIETARALVAQGAAVVGTARDLAKAQGATQAVRDAAASGGAFELIELDLADLASVRSCADKLLADGRRFDLVIANAGVMATPFGKTKDGFETQFGTNHLGHFVLINRIASLINTGGRVVMLSSSGHGFSDVNLDDPGFESTRYTPFRAYGRAKTANVLFAVEFDRRHKDRGVRATALHPGNIRTELGRHMTPEALEEVLAGQRKGGAKPRGTKTIPQGAATSVWAAAVAPIDEIAGKFCDNCAVSEVVAADAPIGAGVRTYALDPDNAKALWAKSEEMVGERF